MLSSFYIGVRSFVKSTGFLFLFPPPLHSIVNLFTVCPVRTKTFSTHVASEMVHVVRKTGLSTHAVTTLCPHQGAYRTRIDRPIRNVVFGVMPFRAQRLLTVVWYLTAIEPSVSPDLIL